MCNIIRFNGIFMVFSLLVVVTNASARKLSPDDEDGIYTNKFAVKVNGGDEVAREVASEHGFEFIKKIGELENYYLIQHKSVPSRSKRSAHDHKKSLSTDHKVDWFQQQTYLTRIKRDISSRPKDKVGEKENTFSSFDDPLWAAQWYFHNTPSHTMNVIPVWNRNITGHGVVVSILDDGIEYDNDDLRSNYDHEASYDYNDDDDDPRPRYDPTNFNSHGTRCAGVAAMEANNGVCGTGVAFNANIGGVRMLDGDITDLTEAEAFGHKNNYVDIYSCSWGPSDDSQTVEGPHRLASEALENAVEKGRHGKGNIFVWAAGNGGYDDDDCICDGYASSIYTIAISAVENNKIPNFAEKCSSIMASTYSFSGDTREDRRMITTDLHNECTSEFCGTSASTPMAAGILALALEANPNLTWRDVQHIVIWTAKIEALRKNQGWYQNAIGLWVNRAIGFGLMDADAIVTMADPKTWRTVPEKNICTIIANDTSFTPKILSSDNSLTISVPVNGCSGTPNHVKYLEHVELFLNIDYPRRGALNINITSYSGTETTVLSGRKADRSEEGFYYWAFVSVHTWGEEAAPEEDQIGMWTITVWDSVQMKSGRRGWLNDWILVLHGTETLPAYRTKTSPKPKDNNRQNKRMSIANKVAGSGVKPAEENSEENNPDLLIEGRLRSKRNWQHLHSLHRLE